MGGPRSAERKSVAKGREDAFNTHCPRRGKIFCAAGDAREAEKGGCNCAQVCGRGNSKAFRYVGKSQRLAREYRGRPLARRPRPWAYAAPGARGSVHTIAPLDVSPRRLYTAR